MIEFDKNIVKNFVHLTKDFQTTYYIWPNPRSFALFSKGKLVFSQWFINKFRGEVKEMVNFR